MKLLCACVFGCLLLAPNVSGVVVTVGTQGVGAAGQNCGPFGCGATFGYTTYQQIYASTAFPGPIAIRQITFFNTTSVSPENFSITPGIYTLSLSSTTVAVNSLSIASPASNLGADNQVFFSGNVSVSFNGGIFTFVGSVPFVYDPGTGRNLLLTVSLNFTGAATGTSADADPAGTVTRRAVFGIPNFSDSIGLVTQFSDVAIPVTPLPSTLTLTLLGMAALGLNEARRRNLLRFPTT